MRGPNLTGLFVELCLSDEDAHRNIVQGELLGSAWSSNLQTHHAGCKVALRTTEIRVPFQKPIASSKPSCGALNFLIRMAAVWYQL